MLLLKFTSKKKIKSNKTKNFSRYFDRIISTQKYSIDALPTLLQILFDFYLYVWGYRFDMCHILFSIRQHI